MNDLSGRAAFDREMSDLARFEAEQDARFRALRVSISKSRRWVRHSQRKGRPTASGYEERRAKIWDMLGSYGLTSDIIADEIGIDISQVGYSVGRGRPLGCSWHDVVLNEFPEEFERPVRLKTARMMAAAARRWSCPARAIFGAGSRKTVRIVPVFCARVEVVVRLREIERMKVTDIGPLMRIHHSAVAYYVRLVKSDPRFAFLQEEIAAHVLARIARRQQRGVA